jgi:hypothetical protein
MPRDARERVRLLDLVRAAVRVRHPSRRTEEAYVVWVRRFVRFHGLRHPAALGEPEVSRFLSHLAVDGGVSASTQNQALSALPFLNRDVLAAPVGWWRAWSGRRSRGAYRSCSRGRRCGRSCGRWRGRRGLW